jgi:hypothetical protein
MTRATWDDIALIALIFLALTVVFQAGALHRDREIMREPPTIAALEAYCRVCGATVEWDSVPLPVGPGLPVEKEGEQ